MKAPTCGLGLILLVAVAGCSDLRDFRGRWRGSRIGSDPSLLVGALGTGPAELMISSIDRHGLHGHLAIDGLADSDLDSIPGAEADVLAGMTFDGSPLRVYLGFAELQQGDGALAIVSLYDDSRVELRLLRGGPAPLYGIFALARGSDAVGALAGDDEPSL